MMFEIKFILISWILFMNIFSLNGLSSPLRSYDNYTHSIDLQANLADLRWSIDNLKKEITFEFHVRTTGWIAFGISPAGGMKGADVGLGWIDRNGRLHFEDRYSTGPTQPLVDTTSSDWVALQGREENGWTAIQFKRPFDTCDKMDVPIKSGTNVLIYAYGIEDPEIVNNRTVIRYHENRRFTKIIPLKTYANPPVESKFSGLDYFDYKFDNYKVPAKETSYHCKIFKSPTNFREHRHSIGYKVLIDSRNYDLVHHVLMYECNPGTIFDDNNLPSGVCDELVGQTNPCTSNIANGWAVGADELSEFPETVGYPMGGDFEIKYYLVEMHYDNPKLMNDRFDSSGIRFYFGAERRQHELGFLSFGTSASVYGIVIPPKLDRFIVDSYCPSENTQRIPQEGITIFNAFPHTHLQGTSLWTKVIRNKTAIQYLFNAESYDFNYQFGNKLEQTIKVYPGDEFATRCIYQSSNKDQVTLGGEATKNEMCLHMFSYYPRMKNMYVCFTQNQQRSWASMVNSSAETWDFETTRRWALEKNWTPENSAQWQEIHRKAPRIAFSGRSNDLDFTFLNEFPEYKDFNEETCENNIK